MLVLPSPQTRGCDSRTSDYSGFERPGFKFIAVFARTHQQRVCDVARPSEWKSKIHGGLEASRITPEIATELRKIHPAIIYCANDRPGDVEKLRCAATNLFNAGFTKASHRLAAYVFLGYKGDTIEKAEARLRETWDAGFVPFAMLMRCPLTGLKIEAWKKFTKQWIRPVLIFRNLKIR